MVGGDDAVVTVAAAVVTERPAARTRVREAMEAAMAEAAMAEAAVATFEGSATAAAGSAAVVLGCAAGRRIGGAPVREGGGGLDGGGDVGGGGGGDGGRGDDGPDLQTRGAWREHVVWGQRRVAGRARRFKSGWLHL